MSVAVSIDPKSVSSLQQLNSELALYGRLARKTMDEVLDKKGRDFGIQLYRSFSDHKFGPRGIAKTQLRDRTAAGLGTKVRPVLKAKYEQAIKQGGKVKRGRGRSLSLWQKIVGAEVALRQSGAGALAASFLMFRNRTSQAEGTRQVVNRTGKLAGQVIRGNGTLSIIGYTPGLATVDRRYGIVASAAESVRADMAPYIARKLAEAGANFRYIKAA